MKVIKKGFISFICLIMVFSIVPSNIKAETLNDAIADANKAEAEYNATQQKQAMTKAEKDKTYAQRKQVIADQEQLGREIKQAQKDIEVTNEKIKQKNEEIKEVVSYLQISNGESEYLEYIYGAKDFTDFIYRVSISEQLSNYNKKKIEEFNTLIEELKQKQKDLENKKTSLKNKEKELEQLEAKLGDELAEISDEVITTKEAYTAKRNYANTLKNKGCKGDEEISACLNRLAGSIISTNGAYLPLSSGRVTSNFGYDDPDRSDYHKGMDFGTGSSGSPIYPIANGQVVAKFYRSCGQWFLYIIHSIAGTKYTSVTMHMSSTTVDVGSYVTYNTKIGVIGPTDTCSSGPHVHVGLTKGWAISDYSLGNFNGRVINPRTVLKQAPAQGRYFGSRG